MPAPGARPIVWRVLAVTVFAATLLVGLSAAVAHEPTSTVTSAPGRAAADAPSADHPRFPPSIPFPDARRRGDSLIREGMIVGVQIEALDAVVRPDGGTEPGFPLPVGTDFFLVEDVFLPDPASPRDPAGDPIGTGRTHCIVQPPQGLVISCNVTLEFTEGSTIYGIETIDFRTVTPNEPLTAALAITGGTGQLIGATGECSLTDREDHATSGISFYDCRLAQPYALVRRS